MQNEKHLVCALVIFIFLSSCVNRISDEENNNGLIPVSLSVEVQHQPTRVTDTAFEEKDAIGLYILVKPETLDGERYVDNIKFSYTSGKFTSASTVYYPEDGETCDFISYHPYKSKAAPESSSTIDVTVKSNQTEWKSFLVSDFLVANTKDISPTKNPVNLIFNHKLYRLNIKLKPTDGYTLEQLLNLNPKVTISDVYSKASFDFTTEEFSNYSSLSDITPYGEWRIENGMLVGKSANIIPQKLGSKHTLIKLEINGLTYQTTLNNYELNSGKAEDYNITIAQRVTGSINPSINGWEIMQKDVFADETSPQTGIKISDLNFAKSNIYKVISGGEEVAEICREYLASTLKAQAIVIYPMKNGETDLEKGILIKNLKNSGKVNGGTVSWNKQTNSLNYSAQQKDAIEEIYISPNYEILFSKPENALEIKAEPYYFNDVRGTESISYPVTKIATQYWMAKNLHATKYTNGTDIVRGDDFFDTSAKYSTPDEDNIFYNAAAVENKFLAPTGWRISNGEDWDKLNNYIVKNASLIKAGNDWINTGTSLPTNLTGFNAQVTGFYNGAYQDMNYSLFWCMNNTDENAILKRIVLQGNDNNAINESPTIVSGLGISIRCIRK